jgi:hypothetical protein
MCTQEVHYAASFVLSLAGIPILKAGVVVNPVVIFVLVFALIMFPVVIKLSCRAFGYGNSPLVPACSVVHGKHRHRKFPRRRITADCSHEHAIFLNYLQHAIDSQIRNRTWGKLDGSLCYEKLPFEYVKLPREPRGVSSSLD